MNVAISTHILSRGPADEMKKYLLEKKIGNLLWIHHPLEHNKKHLTNGYQVFVKGKLQKEEIFHFSFLPGIVQYALDLFLNISIVLSEKKSFDLYVGYNNINAFSGIILKKLGVVKKCVYYVVDYTPKRFENKLLNYIYHRIEVYCAKHCDETWNLTERMINAREKFQKVSPDMGNQKILPMGVWLKDISPVPFNQVNVNRVVFVGTILEKQGIQDILKAVPRIIKRIPKFEFIIIGDGEYLKTLKILTKELNIENNVKFLGYVPDINKVNDIIKKSALGIALYKRGDILTNYTYYSDPGKIKQYLNVGVPILTTAVPHNAHEIVKNRCGFIVNGDEKVIAKTIIDFLLDKKKLRDFRKNAVIYSKQFSWEKMLETRLGF